MNYDITMTLQSKFNLHVHLIKYTAIENLLQNL